MLMLCDFSKASTSVAEAISSRCSNISSKMGHMFLVELKQVKVGSHVSTIVLLNARCPLATLFGSFAFVAHINDLRFPDNAFGIKYMDDSSAAHSFKNTGGEGIQECVDYINDWTKENHMKNNAKKTNKMISCLLILCQNSYQST